MSVGNKELNGEPENKNINSALVETVDQESTLASGGCPAQNTEQETQGFHEAEETLGLNNEHLNGSHKITKQENPEKIKEPENEFNQEIAGGIINKELEQINGKSSEEENNTTTTTERTLVGFSSKVKDKVNNKEHTFRNVHYNACGKRLI